MREIVVDIKTTGMKTDTSPQSRLHRVIEIGCVELIDKVTTGKIYHQFINPECDIPKEYFDVHGLSNEMLKGHPIFEEIVEEFLGFIATSKFITHNASNNILIINSELELVGKEPISIEQTVDTLLMARNMYPGEPSSLDALCERFGIDSSYKNHHGALKRAWFLSKAYQNMELITIADLLAGNKSLNGYSYVTGTFKDKQVLTTSENSVLAFVTLSDASGSHEVTMFREAYMSMKELRNSGTSIIAKLETTQTDSYLRITAHSCCELK